MDVFVRMYSTLRLQNPDLWIDRRHGDPNGVTDILKKGFQKCVVHFHPS